MLTPSSPHLHQNCKNLKTEPTAVGLMKKMEDVYKIKDDIVLFKIKISDDTMRPKFGLDLIKYQLRHAVLMIWRNSYQ
jgi:hypothetical protein